MSGHFLIPGRCHLQVTFPIRSNDQRRAYGLNLGEIHLLHIHPLSFKAGSKPKLIRFPISLFVVVHIRTRYISLLP